jgi:hypothetical protein
VVKLGAGSRGGADDVLGSVLEPGRKGFAIGGDESGRGTNVCRNKVAGQVRGAGGKGLIPPRVKGVSWLLGKKPGAADGLGGSIDDEIVRARISQCSPTDGD